MQGTVTVDFAEARKRMVDGQIRPNKVSDPRLLAALLTVPRERFLPADRAALAYADEDVPLGGGRVMTAPMTIARLVQLTAPVTGDRALVVGAGAGYGAMLLSACGARVVALEEDKALLAMARRMVSATVTLVEGPLAAGWAEQAPYDIILIEGAVDDVPATLAAQLRPETGRLVTVRAGRGQASQALLAESMQGRLHSRTMFDCALPALPSLRAAPSFVF